MENRNNVKIVKKSVKEFVEMVIRNLDVITATNYVGIVAHYDMLIDIFNELFNYKGQKFNLVCGELYDSMYNGYDREYILYIDGNHKVNIDPVYLASKDVYLGVGDCLTFIHSDCNSRFLLANPDIIAVEFDIADMEDDEDIDDDYDDMLMEDDDDDDIDLEEMFGDFDEDEDDDDDEDDDELPDYNLDTMRDDDGELIGFTQSFNTENAYFSRSFYSQNPDLVKQALKDWA